MLDKWDFCKWCFSVFCIPCWLWLSEGDVFAYSVLFNCQVFLFYGAIGADGRYWYILVVLFLRNISLVMRRKVFYGISIAKNDKNSLYGQKNAVFDDIVKTVIALDCVFLVF